MGWRTYTITNATNIDQAAQQLVLNAKKRDRDSLNQAYKMREAVAYGLERFWGEQFRLEAKEPNKSLYWKTTWDTLVEIVANAGIEIPNDPVDVNNPSEVESMARKLWGLSIEDRRFISAILSQLCDSMVWWTQRYK